MSSVRVTEGMVESWLGTDWEVNDVLEILASIANNEYLPSVLKSDIINTAK